MRAALETSIERARKVHADQRRTDVTTQVVPGGTVTERFVPVRRVGLYAPGGLAVYPSSVVMNVVPAQEAGVASLVLVSPPQAEHGGLPHPTVLAAAALLGVDEVWAAGGAQAVALLAYGGTDTDGAELEPVDMVTGPGNVYLTAAKRLLRGLIGIDSEAGTTEIAVLADDTADPVHVAADLISQAEHDPNAASVLVTASEALVDAVDAELARQVPETKHTERIRTALTGPQSGAVLVARPRRRAHGRRRLRRRAPGDPDPRRGRRRRAGPQRGGGVRRPVVAGVARRLLRGLQPRPAHRRLRPALGRAVGADVPARRARRRVHRGRAAGGGRPVLTLAAAEDLPAHGQAISRRFGRDGRRVAVPARRAPAMQRRAEAPVVAAEPSPSTSSRCATTCAARPPTAPRSSTSRCA